MAIIDTRRDQMFPILKPEEIDRIRRFGDIAHARAGAVLAKAGEVSPELWWCWRAAPGSPVATRWRRPT